mgnify:FL=1|tara:strand:+ start:755 stop:1120 length:366 start_codon:yes stop_codon:yes gene_type:complete
MFAVQPFSTVGFSEATPFIDALISTNVVTGSVGTAGIGSTVAINATDIKVTTEIGTAGIGATFISGTNVITLSIQEPSIFTWATIDDSVTEETWSTVSTTGTGESWTDVPTTTTTETWSNV